MKNIFLITSALGHDYGVFSYQQRLSQLVGTINSIKYHDPTADIYLCDMSEKEVPKEDLDMIFRMIKDIMLLREHPYIVALREYDDKDDTNRMFRKTLGELVGLNVFFNFVKQRLSGTEGRLFKITGRHRLNDNFSIADHTQHKDKLAVQIVKAHDDKEVFNTRLWSADLSMIDTLVKMAENMHIETFKTLEDTKLLNIIEYSMYKIVHDSEIPYVALDKLGIEGFFGQDGAIVND